MPEELEKLTQNTITDLNEPLIRDTIGNVPVSELTPDDKEAVNVSGDRDQLLEDGKHPNLSQHPIRFLSDSREGKLISMPIEDLVNRSFLLPTEKDGTRCRAKVLAIDTKAYENHMNHVQSHKDFIKFRLKVDDDEFDELVEYNKILNFVEEGNKWHMHRVIAHKRVHEDDSEYDNCPFNILVEWTDGQHMGTSQHLPRRQSRMDGSEIRE